jgi:23S rRNA (uracil1939-C5)-methyltransferase
LKTKNSPTPEIFDLDIDSLSYHGGRGVGRRDGVVVFVPGTAPGDRVRVRVTSRKARFLEAEIVEILIPSAFRRRPPCSVAGRCGGCSWQHVSYDQQIAQKEQILKSALRKFPQAEYLPFVAAPEEFHYRNRVQIHVRGSQWGFFASRTRELIAFDHCWIAEPKINARLNALTSEELQRGGKIEVALTQDGDLRLMGEREPEAALFSQVNTAQNSNLIAQVISRVSDPPAWIVDLFCGSGNLTVPLHKKFPQARTIGIELSRASIAAARSAHSEIEWICGDAGRKLNEIHLPEDEGVIVMDPPRAGCDERVLNAALALHPRRMIYVSCNPATFARDAERLTSKGDYRLMTVQGLDMFPQTEHVELIGEFVRPT